MKKSRYFKSSRKWHTIFKRNRYIWFIIKRNQIGIPNLKHRVRTNHYIKDINKFSTH